MKESVMLVNAGGQMTGTMDKMAVHRAGMLHRAFSVFIFNQQGQLLLQQRAWGKYHSAGKWTNTCCSHPRLGEDTAKAAHRRLKEEMGMDCELAEVFTFTYRHEFADGLIEHEFDHVFMGISDQVPEPEPSEVAAWKYMDIDALVAALTNQPGQFTEWLKICFERVRENYYQLN